MKNSLFRRAGDVRFVAPFTLLPLLAIGCSGCGNKAADPSTTPYSGSNTKNPAAVQATPASGAAAGARSAPLEAAAYQQKMGGSTAAPGAR